MWELFLPHPVLGYRVSDSSVIITDESGIMWRRVISVRMSVSKKLNFIISLLSEYLEWHFNFRNPQSISLAWHESPSHIQCSQFS
jgi:hypothetical protein